MKDGWSYGGNLGGTLSFRWQYPPTAYPFPESDRNAHGDIRYHRAGAAWAERYITMTGGQDVVSRATPADTFGGYRHLHALNVCSGGVHWIADLRPYTRPNPGQHDWGMGPPTVTRGIVYVGTNLGWVVALADPSVWPSNGARCTLSSLDGVACLDAGFQMVPKPAILRALDLGAGPIRRAEPIIANGSLYVATENGTLFRLAPE